MARTTLRDLRERLAAIDPVYDHLPVYLEVVVDVCGKDPHTERYYGEIGKVRMAGDLHAVYLTGEAEYAE